MKTVGRGTRDQIANIHWIIEKARKFQKNIYFCFNDYAKAFDCVDHKKLWKILQEMGLPVPQTPPAQLGTGGSWSASAGPKERDDPGEGRRALGEKAFSSDPRGSLGVPDPPAAAPPECAVAPVAAARARGQNTPPPPLWGW